MSKEWISMYQRPPELLPEPGHREYTFLLETGSRSHTLIFPEYFTLLPGARDLVDIRRNSEITLQKLINFSSEPQLEGTLVVGGSIVTDRDGKLFNSTPVLYNGKVLDYYYKRNLFKNEKIYLTQGNSELILEHPSTGSRWGFLICADVLEPAYFRNYHNTDFIAIPVASPFRPEDTLEDQAMRDKSIFVEGSIQSGALLLKCCLAGFEAPPELKEISRPRMVQGRSLIANADGVIVKAPHIRWRGILAWSTVRNLAELQEYIA